MNARYYDPQLGRFLTEDPIGRAGGSNLYAFVGGDPMSRRDPSGTTVSLDAQYDAVAGAAPMEEFDPSLIHNPFDGGGGGGGLDLFLLDKPKDAEEDPCDLLLGSKKTLCKIGLIAISGGGGAGAIFAAIGKEVAGEALGYLVSQMLKSAGFPYGSIEDVARDISGGEMAEIERDWELCNAASRTVGSCSFGSNDGPTWQPMQPDNTAMLPSRGSCAVLPQPISCVLPNR